jgi:hypothetical protein
MSYVSPSYKNTFLTIQAAILLFLQEEETSTGGVGQASSSHKEKGRGR